MIPETKKEAVMYALQSTFGVSEFEDISQLTAGLSSALVFRIVILNKPYLLRIITRTDAMSDPANCHYPCMKTAAAAGIAPHVWYANTDDRISITDFIDATPFPIKEAQHKVPLLLKQLHSLPPFPFRINYMDKVDGFIQKFRDAKMIPEHMANELFGLYKKITDVYPRNGHDWVSCHNDIKPENVLFDGERVWLVDWEAAFLNDRYLDLAIMGNFIIRTDEDEKEYLGKYFDNEATKYQCARFFLMRQVLHMAYFTFLIISIPKSGKPINFNIPKPGFREFHDLMWAGKISIADMDARLQYALVHMEQLLHNLRLKRFEESLCIVADHPSV